MSYIEFTPRQTRWVLWLGLTMFFGFGAWHYTIVAPNEPFSPYNQIMAFAWLFGLAVYVLHRWNQHFNIVGIN